MSRAEAFLRTREGTVRFAVGDVETRAYGLGASGHVVGGFEQSGGAYLAAFRRHPSGAVDELPAFDAEAGAEALAVNADGVAVGWTEESVTGIQYAARWIGTDLHVWEETNSIALDVNDAGQIVGRAAGACFFEDEGPVYLGGAAISGSTAQAVNDSGHVAGETRLPGFPRVYEAWLWDGFDFTVIGTGPDRIAVHDVNNLDQVVGSTDEAGALLWERGAIHDLSALVADTSVGLRTAEAISDCGVIVGRTSDQQAYVLVPRDDVDTDSDGDALWDRWEACGIDADEDGFVDLELPGANWRYKDLYVEIDRMTGADLRTAALDDVVAAFARVPGADLSTPNPDGRDGIALHLELDESGLPLVSFSDPPWAEFDLLKEEFFGTPAERAGANPGAVREARRRAYRYCIWGGRYGSSSGFAEISGNDLAVTLEGMRFDGVRDEQAGTFMHELGHTLGLQHGGADTINFKPNYFSVMNYSWQVPQSWNAASGDWRLDYSNRANATLRESFLDEGAGLESAAPAGIRVPARSPSRVRYAIYGSMFEDWDDDGVLDPGDVAVDVNRIMLSHGASPGQVLEGHDDWANLDFDFRDDANYQDGVHLSTAQVEMTQAEYDSLSRLPPPDGVTDAPGEAPRALELAVEGFRPNPAGGGLAIAFTLPSAGPARLEVLDVAGRRVLRRDVDGFGPGAHVVRFDAARRLRPGVYVIRLAQGGRTAVARGVVVR